MAHRAFKDTLYPEFARVASALASPRRLELVDLLAQAPRGVDALAAESAMSAANVSQHLQVLKRARLVASARRGTSVIYRLAGPDVVALWLALRRVAEERLPEVERLHRDAMGGGGEPLARDEAARLIKLGHAVLLDVRPPLEFQAGHVAGAISVPLDELEGRLDELPRDRRIIAYCRGAYCLFADEAVALLRKHGFEAERLDGGWPEWLVEGRPVRTDGGAANMAASRLRTV
ncbi:MAG TPA: metalloregulator ArsR/SmtB family transcription factor [Dehalococcoidia bacterium]|nr:metalloregulator ArsR/SmtB family transcription factor [Dehalococcoidia bacterium]